VPLNLYEFQQSPVISSLFIQIIDVQIKERKWNWIGHTLRKPTGAIEKTALDWNPQGARRCDHPRKIGRRQWGKKPEKQAKHGTK
jgi:hypothetical protein